MSASSHATELASFILRGQREIAGKQWPLALRALCTLRCVHQLRAWRHPHAARAGPCSNRQVLALYRSFLRACRRVPESNRGEVLAEVRREFKAQQGPRKEPYAVKYMLSDGRTKLKMLEEMIGMRT